MDKYNFDELCRKLCLKKIDIEEGHSFIHGGSYYLHEGSGTVFTDYNHQKERNELHHFGLIIISKTEGKAEASIKVSFNILMENPSFLDYLFSELNRAISKAQQQA